jgi:2-dehydropantoate 2-reductase
MRFLVFGSGAVGAYLAARLSRAGHPVSLLARPAWAEALQRDGIQIEGEAAVHELHGVFTALPADFSLGPDDTVLLTVKAYDCASSARVLRERVHGNPRVICLLNGIGNEETLEGELGPGRVAAASLTTAVAVTRPGLIRIERERGMVLERAPWTEALSDALRRAGVLTRRTAHRAALKWSKLPTNLVANASSAILGWTPHAVMNHPGLFRLDLEALRETFRVMAALGIHPMDLPGVPVRAFALGVRLPPSISRRWIGPAVARGRGEKLPSFHFDIGRGRSEAPWLHGAVIDRGRTAGIPTPANVTLLHTLLELVDSKDAATAWKDRPDRLLARAAAAGVPGIRSA